MNVAIRMNLHMNIHKQPVAFKRLLSQIRCHRGDIRTVMFKTVQFTEDTSAHIFICESFSGGLVYVNPLNTQDNILQILRRV